MRQRSFAVSTSSTSGVSSGRVESQYFSGSSSSSGHSISSHSTGRGVLRAVSRCAGRTRSAAKREARSVLVPSRQRTVRQLSGGDSFARSFTETGL
jgi:hypothetical protein